MHLAARNGHAIVVKSLIESGADVKVLQEVRLFTCATVNNNNFDMFCSLLQRKCTPLHLATQNGHVEVVESLIKSGADINAVEEVRLCVNVQQTSM